MKKFYETPEIWVITDKISTDSTNPDPVGASGMEEKLEPEDPNNPIQF